MTYLKFILALSVLCLCSCYNKKYNSPAKILQVKSDTTKIIELAIKVSFYGNLPDVFSVKRKYYFKDSILFTADSSLISYIPSNVDSLKFKILSEKEIRAIVRKDSFSEDQPNYLNLSRLEKSDTGYYLQLQSLSAVDFGGGGSIGLYILKEKDSFIVKHKMALSIN